MEDDSNNYLPDLYGTFNLVRQIRQVLGNKSGGY